ncbi:MAG: hypothetical protein K2H20_02790, partial [Bacilli bacterium]|nr:hypothetical protein [Bacilli bacterium]
MKMCDKCGCVMDESNEVCPNCNHKPDTSNSNGLELPKENHRNSMNVSAPEKPKKKVKAEPAIQESPFPENVNPFDGLPVPIKKEIPKIRPEDESPILKHFTESNSVPVNNYNFQTNIAPPKKKNNDLKIIVITFLLLASGGCFLVSNIFSSREKLSDENITKIILSEVEEIKDSPSQKPIEVPEDPNPTEDPEEDPSQPETPKDYTIKQVGDFTINIPNTYEITSYEDLGWTITDKSTGKTMTFIQGVSDIKSYRLRKDELINEMETSGTKVNKTYNTTIKNHDLFIMELSQTDVSYIMFVVTIGTTGKTMLVMAADYANPHTFNYEVLNESLNIIDTAK